MEHKYYYEFIYEYMAFDGMTINNFINNVAESFKPYKVLGDDKIFNEETLNEINLIDFKYKSLLINEQGKSALNVYSYFQNRLTPRRIFTVLRFIEKPTFLTNSELYYFQSLHGYKIGFFANQLYNFHQSEDDPQRYYSQWELNASKLPKYFNEYIQLERIDISKNPGRERFLPGMKFIPAYKIWFGKESQELFGKEKILSYSKSIFSKELENGIIEMQLMDDITKCDSKENQEKQRDIVQYLGIDKMEVSKY